MFSVEKFCYSLSLRAGLLLVSVGYTLSHLTHIVFVSVITILWRKQIGIGLSSVMVHFVLLLICVILFIAVYKENKCLTFLALYADFLQILGFNTARVIYIIQVWYKSGFNTLLAGCFLVQLAMDVFLVIVIQSYYTKLINKQRSTVIYECV